MTVARGKREGSGVNYGQYKYGEDGVKTAEVTRWWTKDCKAPDARVPGSHQAWNTEGPNVRSLRAATPATVKAWGPDIQCLQAAA